MKPFITIITVAMLVTACDSKPPEKTGEQRSENIPVLTDDEQTKQEILFYRHPMNPEITSPVPREDSMGMPYTPVYADQTNEQTTNGQTTNEPTTSGIVAISPAIVQSLGVTTAQVQQSNLARVIETVGYVSWNEALLHHIHPRTSGWVERVNVHSVGETVSAGQRLFTYYSPDIVTAQRDYLRALANGSKALIDASRERLKALGMAERDLEQLTQTRELMRAIGFYAPFDAVVSQLNVRHGMYITPATEALTLARLDSVWVQAEVYPQQMHALALGQPATISSSSLPGRVFHGTLDYLAPAVDTITRTRRARMTLNNPAHLLLPGMYVDVRIHAQAIADAVHIPVSALIRTGSGARVVLALGEGRFVSRTVTPGEVSNGRVVITNGLSPGMRVVTSAQFLLDSESSLRQMANRLNSESGLNNKTEKAADEEPDNQAREMQHHEMMNHEPEPMQ